MSRLVAILVIVIGGLNVLLGLVGLLENYSAGFLAWREWFQSGVLEHYRAVRDFLFGWLPFHVPQGVKDGAVIYSGFVFWAAQCAKADLKFRRTVGPLHLGEVAKVLMQSLLGPFYLVSMIVRLSAREPSLGALIGQDKQNSRSAARQIDARSVWTKKGFVQLDGEAFKKWRSDFIFAVAASLITLAIAFLAILYLGTDAIRLFAS